jgi:hypothetical protein
VSEEWLLEITEVVVISVGSGHTILTEDRNETCPHFNNGCITRLKKATCLVSHLLESVETNDTLPFSPCVDLQEIFPSPEPSRLALEPSQPRIQWVSAFFPRSKVASVWSHIHVVPRLRMIGDVPDVDTYVVCFCIFIDLFNLHVGHWPNNFFCGGSHGILTFPKFQIIVLVGSRQVKTQYTCSPCFTPSCFNASYHNLMVFWPCIIV